MKSQYADYFNHDEDAPEYDTDVLNESSDPIRTGYAALLDWVGTQAGIPHTVVDLGCGTGNTALKLAGFKRMIGVDVSEKMLEIAQQKFAGVSGVEWVQEDLLEFFDRVTEQVDAVVSTYAIHHLTETEKATLFERIYHSLKPGGKAVLGDLMFQNEAGEQLMRKKYPNLCECFDDEFFWNLETAVKVMKELGFQVETKRFSDLSWGVVAERPLK